MVPLMLRKEVSEETAEKNQTKLHFTQGDVERKPLGMRVLRVPR